MIGARREDIIGAKNHHVHSIGVLYGYGSLAELTAAQADETAGSVEAFRRLLISD